MTLARFRADPTKVQVSWQCRPPTGWVVKIRRRGSTDVVSYAVAGPWPQSMLDAAEEALAKARSLGVVGIDLDSQWTYEHPWRGK